MNSFHYSIDMHTILLKFNILALSSFQSVFLLHEYFQFNFLNLIEVDIERIVMFQRALEVILARITGP